LSGQISQAAQRVEEISSTNCYLSVTAPDGTTIQSGSDNNNVQQVVLNVPQMGIYTVRLVDVTITTEADPQVNMKQDFALVVTAGL